MLLLAMLSVQWGSALAKRMFQWVSPEGVAVLRTSVAALVLWGCFRPQHLRALTGQQFRLVLAYGVSLGAMNLSFYLAIQRLPIGVAVAIEFLGPLAVAILASRRLLDFVWVACAAVGLIALLGIQSAALHMTWQGVAFALMAALCWALYILFGARIAQSMNGKVAATLGMTFAMLTTWPVLVCSGKAIPFSWHVLGLGVLVGVFASAIPYTLEMMALKCLPTKTFGILMSLEPVAAALCAWLLLGESLSGGQMFGIFSIAIASLGCAMSARNALAK